jgi:hypothetical protein
MQQRIWKQIAEHWTVRNYEMDKREWKTILKNMNPQSSIKCNCGMGWNTTDFLCDRESICPYCDTRIQPFVSNPINKKLVLKYIPTKYHSYIF